MACSGQIVIFGASARAAAFSALRAGLQPWCGDLFADADLQACCPVIRIPPSEYPRSFVTVLAKAPPGPWMYTGGLENHSALVKRISSNRPLWGSGPASLALARSPTTLASIFRSNGISFPAIHEFSPDPPQQGRWLIKPQKGAGGAGITFLSAADPLSFPRSASERTSRGEESCDSDSCQSRRGASRRPFPRGSVGTRNWYL